MAGYLGTKAVLLSTTAADVVGNAEIGGDLTVGGNVGIGTSSPSNQLSLREVTANTTTRSDQVRIQAESSGTTGVGFGSNIYFVGERNGGTLQAMGRIGFGASTNTSSNLSSDFIVETAASGVASEAMRIDSSGNLLVGKTTTAIENVGLSILSTGRILGTADSDDVAVFRRNTSDGDIISLRKDGSTVGSIGTNGSSRLFISSGDTGLDFEASTDAIRPCSGSGGGRDNVIDLGRPDVRFDDIYATNGTIQTSDRNEKQDIEALSDAEQRVAVACKGLLGKFRWKDAVAEKGDDARIHFGIIAQDLQDAFAAEGLDAGRYAMFISSTWWETQTDVPAVEAVAAVYEDVVIPAVLDEEGNEVEPERIEQQLVTEAVEAKDAYTRTDTYETLEEAPEGATERTRLGVRYPELLAFIIGAM